MIDDSIYSDYANRVATTGAALNQAGFQRAQDTYSLYARRLAGRQVSQGDYSGASSTLGAAGDVSAAQALQQGGAMQAALKAEGSGDVQAARAAAATTGSQSSYDGAQQGAMQTAAQRAAAVANVAHILKNTPEAERQTVLGAIQHSGSYAQFGTSPEAVAAALSGPLDDMHLDAVMRAATLPFSGKLGKDEIEYQYGQPVAAGPRDPIKLSSGPGTSETLVSPTTGDALATTTPQPTMASPGQVPYMGGQPAGPGVPFEPKALTYEAGGGVASFDPNAAPSPSPVSAGMVQPGGASGTASRGPGASSYGPQIAAAEARYGIPSGVLASLLTNGERSGANAVSPKGAVGVAQLMPGTAAELGVDPRDPGQAIDGAARYLAQNAQRFGGDWTKAAAAYNAGPGAVAKYGGVPPYRETQGFVQRVAAGAPDGLHTIVAPQGFTNGNLNGVPGQFDAKGEFHPNSGANFGPTQIADLAERTANNTDVKAAKASLAAYQAMKANAGTMSGPAAYSMLDTFARAINPGAVARPTVIQTIEENLGLPAEVVGKLDSLQGKGALPPAQRQQILDAVLGFVHAHYDQATQVNAHAAHIAQSFHGDPSLVQEPLGPRPARFVAGPVPSPQQRQVGSAYSTPKGEFIWTGTGWRKES
jgi:hypothetical protein